MSSLFDSWTLERCMPLARVHRRLLRTLQPVAHLYDILAYHETVREVKRFVDSAFGYTLSPPLLTHPTAQNKAGWPTVMISVADHETGGLSLGSQLDPQVYPESVQCISAILSLTESRYLWYPDALANATHSTFSLASEIHSQAPASESTLRTLLSSGLGIMNATEDEIRSIQDHDDHPAILDTLLADMVCFAKPGFLARTDTLSDITTCSSWLVHARS